MDLKKLDLQKLDYDITRQLLKRSFYHFFLEFWDTVVSDPFVDNWHIRYLCDEVQKVGEWVIKRQVKEYDLIVNVPPGTSKSTIISILFPVWLWANDASLRIISSSYSQDAALPHSLKSRDCLTSEKFKYYFPDLEIRSDNYRKTAYENTAKGMRITTSSGGSITGKHAHLILIDDPHKPPQKSEVRAVEEPYLLQKANDWHDSTLSSRKVDKDVTPTIYIMQRLHESDLTGHILKKNKLNVKHIALPAEWDQEFAKPIADIQSAYDHNGGLLDPLRLSRRTLHEQEINLGSADYAGQYQQRPAPAAGNIILKDWFKFFVPSDLPDSIIRNFYSDTAYGEVTNKNSDSSSTLVWSTYQKNLYIWNSWPVDLPFPDFITAYKQFLVANNYNTASRCYFEPKASGISIIQQLQRETIVIGGQTHGINVIRDEPPKDSKVSRVKGASAPTQAGRVFLLKGASWHNSFIHECIAFPNAAHDDQVDTFASVVRIALQQSNFIVSTV
jgi:predicted phage terminase large subunit-like protein